MSFVALPEQPWVAIGVFDGVHVGHRALLEHAQHHAGDGPVVALTFHPHPRVVLHGTDVALLCPLPERLQLLLDAGATHVEVAPFDDRLRQLSPEAFVEAWLVAHLDAVGVVVGENFRFGHGAAGDVELLRALGQQRGFEVAVAPLVEIDGVPVSSSRVRQLLQDDGDVAAAAALLGRWFSLAGTVVEGARRGRTLNMPTANLELAADQLLPTDGVYAGVAVTSDGARHGAAISVGTNPQFTPDGRRGVEVHLLDFNGGPDDLYDTPMRVDFRARIRGQLTFPGVDELVERMHHDLELIRAELQPGPRADG